MLNSIYDNVLFFKSSTDEEKIDTAICYLTLLSYAIPKKPELCGRFKQAIEVCTNPIIASTNTLLKCRLTLLLGYFIDILYKNDDQIFIAVLEMLVTSIGSTELALAHQAADTLKTIIADRDLIQRVTPHI